jgi:hypothetical protein
LAIIGGACLTMPALYLAGLGHHPEPRSGLAGIDRGTLTPPPLRLKIGFELLATRPLGRQRVAARGPGDRPPLQARDRSYLRGARFRMPSGLSLPSAFGLYTRLIGSGR